ncbi:MAG TPA: alpha-amylase family glycosyl hydrolase [Candidatus Acidoferrales bacterium]|jgi:cyclomaltodextrinase|nr:alpha-amylase family glycosyl hydrolase [Candidatus Acidoferrales bacterium]
MIFLHRTIKLVISASVLALVSLRGWADVNVSSLAARSAPEWLRDGTVYEIFPRDFSAAGNLNGVTDKLDELHRLGVNILWTMPIHPIGEKARKGELGSPYSIKDYYAVDQDYGTVKDYQRLVSAAHQRGMKVIMDLVANHTAWDSVMMQHPEFYKHDAKGKIIPPMPEWTDVAALDYGNPELRRYMIAMLEYWVRTCDVDGFRCDAAGMVPTDFWEKVRSELTNIKPDILLLAEASKPELLTNAFDIDYSWPLLTALADVMGHRAPAATIRRSWEDSCAQFPKAALHLRISDDHDEARAVTRYGINGAVAASALMFTLDGVPLIYNGMEVGDAGRSDGGALFDKRNIAWNSREHPELRNLYHDLIQVRHQYAALRGPRVEWLHNSDETNLVSFLRADEKDELLVVINFSNGPVAGTVDMKTPEGFVPLKIAGMRNSADDLLPAVHLGQYEWRIYHRASTLRRPVASLAPDKN